MAKVEHPSWCSPLRCGTRGPGVHESEPITTSAKGKTPRFITALTAKRATPARIHLILVGDLVINDVSVDLDTAALLLASIGQLIDRAQPIG